MKTHESISKWMTPSPWTLDEGAHVEQAVEIFRTMHIRHLPILREGRLAGVLSERDTFVASQFAQTRGLAVGILMAPDPVIVGPDATLAFVAEKLWTTREGAAVVVEGGKVLGVFTAVDALRALADQDRAPVGASAR